MGAENKIGRQGYLVEGCRPVFPLHTFNFPPISLWLGLASLGLG